MDQETLLTFQGYAKFFLILTVFIIFYSYAYSIYKRQKKGERDFELKAYDRNDELTQILTNLAQFQAELAELDELRLNEKKIQKELVQERDNATHSLHQLQETQSKLIATEKTATSFKSLKFDNKKRSKPVAPQNATPPNINGNP